MGKTYKANVVASPEKVKPKKQEKKKTDKAPRKKKHKAMPHRYARGISKLSKLMVGASEKKLAILSKQLSMLNMNMLLRRKELFGY